MAGMTLPQQTHHEIAEAFRQLREETTGKIASLEGRLMQLEQVVERIDRKEATIEELGQWQKKINALASEHCKDCGNALVFSARQAGDGYCGSCVRKRLATLEAQVAADEFWKTLPIENAEDVRKELADYHYILGQVPKVYNAITGGKLSKPNYRAEDVIGSYEDDVTKTVEEAVKEARQEWAAAWTIIRPTIDDRHIAAQSGANKRVDLAAAVITLDRNLTPQEPTP